LMEEGGSCKIKWKSLEKTVVKYLQLFYNVKKRK